MRAPLAIKPITFPILFIFESFIHDIFLKLGLICSSIILQGSCSFPRKSPIRFVKIRSYIYILLLSAHFQQHLGFSFNF